MMKIVDLLIRTFSPVVELWKHVAIEEHPTIHDALYEPFTVDPNEGHPELPCALIQEVG